VTDDDDRAAEWLDEPTFVEGALPELPDDPGEDETTTVTVARCAECLRPIMLAGPIPPTSAEGARHASPETCLRGDRWSWCATRSRLSLWAS
jgi:hypothetical protein